MGTILEPKVDRKSRQERLKGTSKSQISLFRRAALPLSIFLHLQIEVKNGHHSRD